MLTVGRAISIPGGSGSKFDHGAFDARSGHIFVAHTALNRVEVLDPAEARHLRSLPGHPEAAGVAADDGFVAVTNRGDGTVSLFKAERSEELNRIAVGPRPNGVALRVGRDGPRVVVATLGDERTSPSLVRCGPVTADGSRISAVPLPGAPRWLVMNSAGNLAFCAIKSPSQVLVLDVERHEVVAQWPLQADGAHGIDLDEEGGRLFIACDAGELAQLDPVNGSLVRSWPISGVPDAIFYSPESGKVHVAIGDPGIVASINAAVAAVGELTPTAPGAKTTALVRPGRLFAFLPTTGEALELIE